MMDWQLSGSSLHLRVLINFSCHLPNFLPVVDMGVEMRLSPICDAWAKRLPAPETENPPCIESQRMDIYGPAANILSEDPSQHTVSKARAADFAIETTERTLICHRLPHAIAG